MNSISNKVDTSVAERIIASLAEAADGAVVADARIGLGYTGVMLQDGRTGVAYTFRDQAKRGCSVFRGLRPLAGRPAADLLPLIRSRDPIEAGVGLACANALINGTGVPGEQDGDVLEHLDIGPDDHVGMVGHFGPLVGKIKERARALTIFEKVSSPTGCFRPQGEALTTLPKCQIALITGTSVINHTVEELLCAAKDCRHVVILGASTTLSVPVFAGTGVTMLSGVIVESPASVLRVVSEGGGMGQFKGHVRKVIVKVNG